MNVRELIALLNQLPQEAEVVFRGYACGGNFNQPLNREDIVLGDKRRRTEKGKIVIVADWN